MAEEESLGKKKKVRRYDPNMKGYYETEEGENKDVVFKDKVQDASGVGSVKRTEVKEEEDPSKMSPLQRAAYENKKKKKAQDIKGF